MGSRSPPATTSPPGLYQASFEALTGTIVHGGRTLDVDSVDHTGAVTATDHLTRVTSAATPVLGTAHRSTGAGPAPVGRSRWSTGR